MYLLVVFSVIILPFWSCITFSSKKSLQWLGLGISIIFFLLACLFPAT